MPQLNALPTVWRLTAALLLALLVAGCGPELPAPAISMQSPIETPTETPTARPHPTRTPPRATPMPPQGTPTALPTAPGPLPPGPKLIYARLIGDKEVGFWAASAINPTQRKLFTTADPARGGVRATLSHDESRIAYTFANSTKRWAAELWTVRIDGAERTQLATGVETGTWVNYPMWSPDDRYLAFIRTLHATSPQVNTFPYTQTITMIDVTTAEETPLVQSTVSRLEDEMRLHIWPLDWSVDGRHFFYKKGAAGHVELWRVDVVTLETEYVATITESGIPSCYFLSPDRQWLLCTVQTSYEPPEYAVVRVPTAPGGGAEVIAGGAAEDDYHPIWGMNSDEVTFNMPPQANQQAQLRTLNVRTGQGRTLAATEEGSFAPFGWSPDGRWLATTKSPIHTVWLISDNGALVTPMQDVGPLIGWLDAESPKPQR